MKKTARKFSIKIKTQRRHQERANYSIAEVYGIQLTTLLGLRGLFWLA